MAIRYPTNYNSTADLPADLEDMAESIQEELDKKVDEVTGKGLSTNDYTTEEKNKLAGIEAQANKTVVDASLSETSTNPVQNKKVYEALAEKQEQIDALVEENSTLKKQQLKGHASGSSIQLTDSAEDLEIENVVIKGAMEQETRVGYNLFKPAITNNGTNIIYNQSNISLDEDEFSFVALGADVYFGQVNGVGISYTDSDGIKIDVEGLTKIAFELTNTNFAKNYFTAYDENAISLGYTRIDNYKGTYTIPNGAKFVTFRFGLSAGVTGTTYSTKVLVYDYSNEIEKEYEKYGATPSTEYESQVHGVTGICNINFKNNDLTLQQNAPLSLGNIELYDGDKIQISYINKAGYKKVTGANIGKKYNKYVFTGNETISLQVNSNGYYAFKFALENSKAGRVQNQYISNMFKQKATASWDAEGIINVSSTERSDVYIFVSENTATTVSEFKTKLSNWYANGTPMYIVYQLNELNTTPITDTTLLSQLETLINLKTHKQITNIETTGSDLAPVLEFQYSKDLQTVIDSINARLELVEN